MFHEGGCVFHIFSKRINLPGRLLGIVAQGQFEHPVPVHRHMISKLIETFSNWRNRCRSCEVDGIAASLIDRCKDLREVATTKTVREFECEKCGTSWVLAERSRFVSKVIRNELFAIWKSRSWKPNAGQRQVLDRIVGAADGDKKNVYFPCQIKLKNGSMVRKAIIIATTGDCFGKFPLEQEVAILNGNHEISPSIHALPTNVRAATMVAPERSMGYSPVNVKDTSGNRYTLSSQMHFFESNGVLGPDVMLDDSEPHRKNIIHPDWADMYLICDMFECNTADPRQCGT